MVCCQIVDLDKASFAVLLVLSAARRLVLIQIESTIWGKKGADYSKLGGAGWFSGCLWGMGDRQPENGNGRWDFWLDGAFNEIETFAKPSRLGIYARHFQRIKINS